MLVLCENRECCPSICYNQISPPVSQASRSNQSTAGNPDFVENLQKEGFFSFYKFNAHVVCSRRFVFLISVMAILVSWTDGGLVFMSVSSVASGIETVFSGFGGLKILRNCSWHLFSRSSARDKTVPFLSLTDMFPLLYKTLSVFLTIYSVLRSCPASASSAFSARFSIYSFLSLLTIVFTSLSRFSIFFCSALSLSRSLSISCGYVARDSSVFKFKSSHDESFPEWLPFLQHS